jgi:hypothetical protein
MIDTALENAPSARAGKAQICLHDGRGAADLIARDGAPVMLGEGLMNRLLDLISLGLVHRPAMIGKHVENAVSGPCLGDDTGGFRVVLSLGAVSTH